MKTLLIPPPSSNYHYMPKKSTSRKVNKVSNKFKIHLDPNPTVDNISNFEYQEPLNKVTTPVVVDMPPVVMQDIRRLPSKEKTYKELPPREDAEEIKTFLATNPYVKEYPMNYTGKVKTYVDIQTPPNDSNFLPSTYAMTKEEQEALKATTEKVVSEYNNSKDKTTNAVLESHRVIERLNPEYNLPKEAIRHEARQDPMGKTKSKWEKSLEAAINWFKNLFN